MWPHWWLIVILTDLFGLSVVWVLVMRLRDQSYLRGLEDGAIWAGASTEQALECRVNRGHVGFGCNQRGIIR